VRVIGGAFKGRRITAPKNLPSRPTTDMAKESIFNILNNHYYFEDIVVLDLFSGIGSICYEMASRGVPSIVSVEQNFHCTRFIKQTVAELKADAIQVLKADVFSFLEKCNQKFDVIFADPPYDLENIDRISELVFEKDTLAEGGLLIVEHGPRTDLSGQKHFAYTKRYGHSTFSFFDPAYQQK
jgi:16S rRNA (guanine966-N2)-methyltransferase